MTTLFFEELCLNERGSKVGRRKLSDEKAKKVAGFLLDEGISQAKIAA